MYAPLFPCSEGLATPIPTQLIGSQGKAESRKLPRKTLPTFCMLQNLKIKACHWYPDCCLRPNNSSPGVNSSEARLLHLPCAFVLHSILPVTDPNGQSVLLIHRLLVTGIVHPEAASEKKGPCRESAFEKGKPAKEKLGNKSISYPEVGVCARRSRHSMQTSQRSACVPPPSTPEISAITPEVRSSRRDREKDNQSDFQAPPRNQL